MYSFKELLLRKAGDTNLQTLIEYMGDDMLVAHVLESLEKMAQHRSGASTTKANQLVHQFANMIDPHDIETMRSAMGHHAARFGAAIKEGHKDVANKHAKQWVALNDLARKVQSGAGVNIGWHMPVDIKAWQAHEKDKYYDKSKDRMDIPGLQYHHNKKPSSYEHLAKPPIPENAGPNGAKQYVAEILDSKHEHPSGEDRYHNGPYPMEHVKMGGKYPSISDQDTKDIGMYKEHLFDKHPIMQYFTHKESDINEPALKDYGDKLLEYEESKHHPDHQALMDNMTAEGHGAKPQHDAVHGPDVERYDLSKHIDKKMGK